MDDSALRMTKLERKQRNFQRILMKKKVDCKTQHFYILLAFLLINISFLIAVSIYCYQITYRTKQKHLLWFRISNNEFRQVLYW